MGRIAEPFVHLRSESGSFGMLHHRKACDVARRVKTIHYRDETREAVGIVAFDGHSDEFSVLTCGEYGDGLTIDCHFGSLVGRIVVEMYFGEHLPYG